LLLQQTALFGYGIAYTITASISCRYATPPTRPSFTFAALRIFHFFLCAEASKQVCRIADDV
jgi:hypothetical protein